MTLKVFLEITLNDILYYIPSETFGKIMLGYK